jgi:hypothetical protein
MNEVELDTKAVDATIAQKLLHDQYDRHLILQKGMNKLN